MTENKLGKSLLKIIPYLLMILAGLYLAVLVTKTFMGFAQYKLTFTDHWQAILTNVALHPITYYRQYLSQKNPILIIISIAAIVYTTYFALKRNAKNKKWQTADTDTHGSATWGSLSELLTNYYFKVSQRDLTQSFDKSLDHRVIEQLNRKEE